VIRDILENLEAQVGSSEIKEVDYKKYADVLGEVFRDCK